MASLQRRRSVEPGTAFQVGCAKAHAPVAAPPSPSNASASVDSPASPAQLHFDPFSSLKSDYVVPPMSSVSVDPPIPAETDSRSAQDQHPMRANLPLLSQPLLSTEAFHLQPDRRPSGPYPHPPAPGHATVAPIPLLLSTSPSPNNHLNPNQPVAPHARRPHSRPHHCQDEARCSTIITTTTTTTVATNTGGPTLLTLPPEIRRLIYQHIPDLINQQPLIYCLSLFRNRRQHSLGSICRLMRAEALEMYYSSNTWLIKLEYRDFYDSFKSWVGSLDAASANSLRQLRVSVRSTSFARGLRWHVAPGGTAAAAAVGVLPDMLPMSSPQHQGYHQYLLPHERASAAGASYGYATFGVDLSERWADGRVEVLACDGCPLAGREAKMVLEGIVKGLWEKRRRGEMRGVDLKEAMDRFLDYNGWWP